MGMRTDTHGSTLTQVAMGPEISPTMHPLIADAVQVVCRAAKTLVLTRDGAVYSWGTCENSSLGHGADVKVVHRPRRIEALAGIRITSIGAGETASAAVSAEGDVYTWGWGGSFWQGNGGLGHGDSTTQPRPALVQCLEEAGTKVLSVSVGNGHMLAVTKDGTVLSWGNGEYGRCGNGKRAQLLPEPVDLLAGKMCVAVAAGFQHSLALTADGVVFAWGKNDAGQLGQVRRWGGQRCSAPARCRRGARDYSAPSCFFVLSETSVRHLPFRCAGRQHGDGLEHDGRVPPGGHHRARRRGVGARLS